MTRKAGETNLWIPRYLTRLSGHILWTGLDFIGRLGLTRLVCFPLIAIQLGNHEFGEFVLAFSIATMFGGSVGIGFNNFILRNINGMSTESQLTTRRSCVAMVFLATLLVFAVVMLLCPLIAERFRGTDFLFWLSVMSVHYVILNPSETALTMARVNRNFRKIALVHAAGAIAMLIFLNLFPMLGRTAIVVGIISWAAFPLWLCRSLIPRCETWIQRESAPKIISVSAVFAVAEFVKLSGTYLDRVILALWWPAPEVSAFFAAISMGLLFNTPALILGTLALSLLGKAENSKKLLNRRFLIAYAGAVVVLAVGIFLLARPLGAAILQFFYPEQAEAALLLWDYSVGSAAASSVMLLLRPFVLKFLSPNLILGMSLFSLAVRVPLLIYFVPGGGHLGAAFALCLGTLLIAIAWLFAYGYFVAVRGVRSHALI